MKAAGFTVESGVARVSPQDSIASYGHGKLAVIALLGELDCATGIAQQTVPERPPVTQGGSGHACGHNLLGSGAALAAVAVRQSSRRITLAALCATTELPRGGRRRQGLYGARRICCCSKDVDVVLHWHPADRNEVTNGGMLAITGAHFTFHGVAAHAAMAPDRGRSALDAVMLMGTGIEYMREHVHQQYPHSLHHRQGRRGAEHRT